MDREVRRRRRRRATEMGQGGVEKEEVVDICICDI